MKKTVELYCEIIVEERGPIIPALECVGFSLVVELEITPGDYGPVSEAVELVSVSLEGIDVDAPNAICECVIDLLGGDDALVDMALEQLEDG